MVEPFYFGARDAPLFGIYHPPAPLVRREAAVLLCHPIGHDYIVCHRAFRQLSMRLSEAGFPVLRFDYSSTGDSSGACEDGNPREWLRDISTAIGELRLRSGCARLCLIGCRLGATLSAMVGAERGDIRHMVLWDAVSSGKAYIAEITRRQEDMLARTHVSPPVNHESVGVREFLGFAMAEATLREIEAIDLLAMRQQPASHMLFVDSDVTDTTAPLRQHMRALDTEATHRHVPIRNAWTWTEDASTVLVPHQILQTVVSWVIAMPP